MLVPLSISMIESIIDSIIDSCIVEQGLNLQVAENTVYQQSTLSFRFSSLYYSFLPSFVSIPSPSISLNLSFPPKHLGLPFKGGPRYNNARKILGIEDARRWVLAHFGNKKKTTVAEVRALFDQVEILMRLLLIIVLPATSFAADRRPSVDCAVLSRGWDVPWAKSDWTL